MIEKKQQIKKGKKGEFSSSFNLSIGHGENKTSLLGWNLKVRTSGSARKGSCRSAA
jgi:hypothetical protein